MAGEIAVASGCLLEGKVAMLLPSWTQIEAHSILLQPRMACVLAQANFGKIPPPEMRM